MLKNGKNLASSLSITKALLILNVNNIILTIMLMMILIMIMIVIVMMMMIIIIIIIIIILIITTKVPVPQHRNSASSDRRHGTYEDRDGEIQPKDPRQHPNQRPTEDHTS